jgi:hypothetical protein
MGSTVFPSGIGPANSDIAAAVAAPSAATIATAVAAPSSATIATAVAAAVPTISAINSSVSTYASPFGTVTGVANGTALTGASGSVSSLGGYKRLRIYVSGVMSATGSTYFRFNADSGSNYFYTSFTDFAGNNTFNMADTSATLRAYNGNYGTYIEILNSNSTSTAKHFYIYDVGYPNASGRQWGHGVWNSTSAITSFNIYTSGNLGSTKIWVEGAA